MPWWLALLIPVVVVGLIFAMYVALFDLVRKSDPVVAFFCAALLVIGFYTLIACVWLAAYGLWYVLSGVG